MEGILEGRFKESKQCIDSDVRGTGNGGKLGEMLLLERNLEGNSEERLDEHLQGNPW